MKQTLRRAQWACYAMTPVMLVLVGNIFGRRWF